MNDRENQSRKKNQSGGGKGILIALGVIILMNVIGAGGGSVILVILAIVLIVAVAVIGLKAGKKAIKQKTEDQAPVQWKRPGNDLPQNAQRPVSATQIVYNENASAENFQRDRQRRIAQLDGFLKNGIIDKEEYEVLLSRYERDI